MSLLEKSFEMGQVTIRHLVDDDQDNLRLDQFAQTYLSSFSREIIKRKIAKEEIVISNRPFPHRPSTRVHRGETVTIYFFRNSYQNEVWRGEEIEMLIHPEIIFEDDRIIVISKPPFMTTHPTGKHIFNCATVYFSAIHNRIIHAVHRLDRETSGILILAKDPLSAHHLSEQFENNVVKKCYFFISIFDDKIYKGEKELIARERLGTEGEGRDRICVNHYSPNSTMGKNACTIFKIIYREDNYLLGLAFPQTGRQHQIRVHAAVHGFPLLGDKIYCGGYKMFQRFKDHLASEEDHDFMQIPRHALHALAIKVKYLEKPGVFISHLPKDLREWIEKKLVLDITDLTGQIEQEINNRLRVP